MEVTFVGLKGTRILAERIVELDIENSLYSQILIRR